MQLNYANFFRWYTGNVADDTNNIPRLGKVDGCRRFYPHLVPGEIAGFFINAALPFLDTDDTDTLHLRIVGGSDLGPILQKVTVNTGYRLYTTFALPTMLTGFYQFEVFNTATDVQKAVSNYFRVSDGKQTCLVRYRNSRSMDYFDYQAAPDFYNQFRLSLSLAAISYDSSTETVQNVASGHRRNLNGGKDKSFQVSTYYFDDGAHEAMASLIEHDDIQINGRAYIKKSGYQPNARVISGVSLGQAELYEQVYSSINKYGQRPDKYSGYKLLAIAKDPVSIDVYTANDVIVKSYTNLAYAKELPSSGYVKISGTGKVEVVFIDMNGNAVRQSQNLPLTLQQADLFTSDYFVAIGDYTGNPAPVAPATVKVIVREQGAPLPYVDANAILEIDGVDQPAINSTGEATYTVAAGKPFRLKAFAEGNPQAATPILALTATGDYSDSQDIAAYPGAIMTIATTAKAGGNYVFTVESYGN